jgi:DNA-binding response OmpR family regulator
MSDVSKKRILVVEDDLAIARMLEKILKADYEVMVAHNGAEALKKARLFPPHLALLDVMLPGMDGLRLAERLKVDLGLGKTIIIFVTAKDTPLDMILGIQAGARHYLTKPFKLEEVRDKVAKALGGEGV